MNSDLEDTQVEQSVGDSTLAPKLPGTIKLDEEDQQKISDYAKSLDLNDFNSIENFGDKARNSSVEFADRELKKVKDAQLGDTGKELKDLTVLIKSNKPESMLPNTKQTLLGKLFHKAKMTIYDAQAKIDNVSTQMDAITSTIMVKNDDRRKSNEELQQFYQQTLENSKESYLYVKAGEKVIDEVRNKTLPELKQELSKLAPDSLEYASKQEALANVEDHLSRLSVRVSNLRSSYSVGIKDSVLIRYAISTNNNLIEQTNELISTAIPVWKQNAYLMLTGAYQQMHADINEMVSDITNDSLVEFSSQLKDTNVKVQEQSSRPIITVDTLKQTQGNILEMTDKITDLQQKTMEIYDSYKVNLDSLNGELYKGLTGDKSSQSRKQVN